MAKKTPVSADVYYPNWNPRTHSLWKQTGYKFCLNCPTGPSSHLDQDSIRHQGHSGFLCSVIVNTNESGIIRDGQYAEHTLDEALFEAEDFIEDAENMNNEK